MAKRDYYDVLGVGQDADEAAVKKAYRRLAMKHHPDRNKDDPKAARQFQDIQEAYSVLSNAEKRETYDRFGHEAVSGGAASGAGTGGGMRFEDVFGDIFGGGGHAGGRTSAQRGADHLVELELDLEEAVFGGSREIQISGAAECNKCEGSGCAPGTQPETCSACHGQGVVAQQQGVFRMHHTCPNCHGLGQRIRVPCHGCHGSGRVEKARKLRVKVPAGVDDGDRIRLTGEGEPGTRGGQSGDLFVRVNVRPHALFRRDGTHLHCELPISITLATLGGSLEVPTLAGSVNIKIPAETQTGKSFRLAGKGVKSVRSHKAGDMYCTVAVETPVKLNAKQRALLKELQASMKSDKVHFPRTDSWTKRGRSFVENLKKWLH